MKNIVLIVSFLCCVNSAFSQKAKVKKYIDTYDSSNSVCVTSPDKDTLYIPNDDIGQLIIKIWTESPLDKNPILVTVEKNEIVAMINKKKLLENKKGR